MSSELAGLREAADRVAVAARPLADIERPLFAEFELDPDVRFPAASVIKIGIMSALLDRVARGEFSLSQRLTVTSEQLVGGAGVLFELETPREYSVGELCRLMMVVSDNTASNALARLLGLDALNAFFSKRGYEARMQRFFMHPVEQGRDNDMSPLAALRMLADLYRGRELPPRLCEFAVGCLRRQQFREKIPLMLPPELAVGHKTGELEGVRHDAAVVETPQPYLLAVFTAQGKEPWLVDRAMAEVSLGIYRMATA